MKKFLKNHWPILTILVLSLLVVWPLFLPGYFSHQDDLQVMRIFEMRKCFNDFQLPCRWVPDMGYGFGFPLFNYYSVLPYYIGALLSFLVGFIAAAKILFFIPLVLGGVSMYFLAKELFGKMPAFVSGVLFLFAPYRALDAYVRGDVTESWAIAIVPLVFLFALKLTRKKSLGNILLLALSFGAFLLSHNIMVLFFTPILLVWIIYFILIEKKHSSFLSLGAGLHLGLGLSAFFIFPAFLEKGLVQTENLTRFELDYRANFVEVDKLFFSRFWGYGASGSHLGLSVQVGWPHWWIVALVTLVLFGGVFAKWLKLSREQLSLGALLVVIFLGGVFMTHIRSAFIWEKITILRYAQFPWRFLSVAIFSSSLLGGFLVSVLKRKIKELTVVVIILLTLILNWSFFRPQGFYIGLTDQQKLSGALWTEQQRAAILDYLPKTAGEPKEAAPDYPLLVSGAATFSDYKNFTNHFQFSTLVAKPSVVLIPIFQFPNWMVKSNGEKIPATHDNIVGRISINLTPGVYQINGKLEDTPIRTLSNVVSFLSMGLFLIILAYGKIRKIF